MLVFAAIGVFGAGMLAIAAGIPIKDFGYGNTLILSGVMAFCTSAIMLTLWACFRNLKKAQPRAEKSGPNVPQAELRPAPLPLPTMPPGWPEAIPERVPAPPPAAAVPAPPPSGATREARRNLLFTSSRRPKDTASRDIAASADAGSPASPPPAVEARPVPIEEARPPVLRRPDTLPPRTLRPPPTIAPRDPAPAQAAPPSPPAAPLPPPAPPPAFADDMPAASTAVVPREPERSGRSDGSTVSVLKSGVVDGMAYWLYSDGSIEAQMPEGMMRFTSIDELRAHLDKRP